MGPANLQTSSIGTFTTFSRVMAGAKTKAAGQDAVMALVSSILSYDLTVPGRLEVWESVLADLTSEQIVTGFSRAVEECEFFPTPAKVRALAAVVPSGQQSREEGLAALQEVITRIREFGPRLKTKLGPILNDGKDAEGLVAMTPERGPSTPCPRMPARTDAVIKELGFGDPYAGLAAILVHLSLLSEEDRKGMNAFELAMAARASDRLEQRWLEIYLKFGRDDR